MKSKHVMLLSGVLVLALAYAPGLRAQTTCSQDQKLTAGDAAADDFFGESVAVDGDTLIVGASAESDLGTDAGAAYVFVLGGGTWTQEAKLTASDGAAFDNFGRSVAIDGDTAIVGAWLDDASAFNSGSAYVFVRSGTTWTQEAKLTPADPEAEDVFGQSVAIDGDTVVVGAYLSDDAGSATGSAYVFIRSGTTWSQQAKLLSGDAAGNDHFGISVSVSGDTALIGARLDDLVSVNAGSAYAFVRSGTTWSEQAKLVPIDSDLGDTFGESVSLSGEIALIGAPFNDDAGTDSGSAYVFVRSGSTWSQQFKLLPMDDQSGDNFGNRVSLSGGTAVVAALKDDDAGSDSGSAYVFVLDQGTWVEEDKLVAGDGAADDEFGQSVSVDGGRVLVGARFHDDAGTSSGSAYVFNCSVPMGAACCLVRGGCIEVSESTCDVSGGTYQGNGTTCETTECEPPPVPAHGPWGLVMLALLMMSLALLTRRSNDRSADSP